MFTWFEKRLDPFPTGRNGPPPEGLFRFCWHYCKDAWPWIVAMSVFSAAFAVGEVFLYGILGQIVDWLVASDPATFVSEERDRLILISIFVGVVLPLSVFIGSMVNHQVLLGNMPMAARWRIHRHLLRQSMAFYADEFAGRVATKLMQTSLSIREAVMKLLDIFVYVAVYFITMLALAAGAHPLLAAPLALWLALYVAAIWFFVPRLQNTAQRQADARSEMTGRIVDSYTNIATVKLFAHAGREEDYARESMDGFLQTVHPQMRLVTQFFSLIYFNNCMTIFLVGALSIWLWTAGAVSIGAVATVMALTLRINGMSQWIMWEVSALFENIGVIHDGMKMIRKPIAVEDQKSAKALEVHAGAIALDKITFHYGKGEGVIEDLSLSIAPGEKIGLVGRSGAGKTTLTNLLLRFYDLEGGRITIDNQDIARVRQDSLRASIGVVTQDTSLLHRSIRDNIAYGRPDASDEEVIEAARRANALAFLNELEDQKGRKGLDAHVGERGVKLSGGQRQRIAIARIFLKNAPILILDEATSALDSEVEAAIQESLFDLMKGKTVIAIAHRLSTIAQLDRLVVLDRGAVIESGSHNTLIGNGGLYADLWARQSGGFIGGGEKSAKKADGINVMAR